MYGWSKSGSFAADTVVLRCWLPASRGERRTSPALLASGKPRVNVSANVRVDFLRGFICLCLSFVGAAVGRSICYKSYYAAPAKFPDTFFGVLTVRLHGQTRHCQRRCEPGAAGSTHHTGGKAPKPKLDPLITHAYGAIVNREPFKSTPAGLPWVTTTDGKSIARPIRRVRSNGYGV